MTLKLLPFFSACALPFTRTLSFHIYELPVVFSFLETHIFLNRIFVCDVRVFHSSVTEVSGLLRCYIVALGLCFLTFQKNTGFYSSMPPNPWRWRHNIDHNIGKPWPQILRELPFFCMKKFWQFYTESPWRLIITDAVLVKSKYAKIIWAVIARNVIWIPPVLHCQYGVSLSVLSATD